MAAAAAIRVHLAGGDNSAFAFKVITCAFDDRI